MTALPCQLHHTHTGRAALLLHDQPAQHHMQRTLLLRCIMRGLTLQLPAGPALLGQLSQPHIFCPQQVHMLQQHPAGCCTGTTSSNCPCGCMCRLASTLPPAHPPSSKFLICAPNLVGNSEASKRSIRLTPLLPASRLQQTEPRRDQIMSCKQQWWVVALLLVQLIINN